MLSDLGKAGVSPKLAQTLARHSDPKLTMNIYTHVDAADQATAIEMLSPPPNVDKNVPKKSACSDGLNQGDAPSVAHMVAQTFGAKGQLVATGVKLPARTRWLAQRENPRKSKGLTLLFLICHRMTRVAVEGFEPPTRGL